MGRTTRWLRSLWSGKKEKREPKDYSGGYVGGDDRREKKRWSFGKAAKDPAEVVLGQNASTAAAVEAAWFRSFYAESEKEQSKHVIAVAAATAAAADAAVAAAQAAVAVVRLTNQGRGRSVGLFLSARDCESSAVKIQRAFRGYLARKAFRALKALVKLQALVRGYLVRKQAAATLHSMQALIRAQAAARAQRARNIIRNDRKLLPELRARRSIERFDEARSENMSSLHSRRLSANLDSFSNGGFDRSPKVVEIDTCRPKSRSSCRSNPSAVDPTDDWHSSSISSPLPCQIPSRISIPDCRYFQDHDWCLAGDRYGRLSATAQSTPRYMNPSCNPPLTPAKSVCGSNGVLRRFMNVPSSPSYMASTQSFEAKSRSQSAPKQRPELRKRLPLTEVMLESRASLSGVGMQRSCSRVQEAFNFNSAVVGRLDRSSELRRESAEREYYLQKNS